MSIRLYSTLHPPSTVPDQSVLDAVQYMDHIVHCHFWNLLYRHVRFVSQHDANGETNQVYLRREVGYIGTEVDEWSGGLGS